MHRIALRLAVATAFALGACAPALALDLSNATLSNVRIGQGSGNLGQPGLAGAASISGSRVVANTLVRNSTTGVADSSKAQVEGVVQTTKLEAGGNSYAGSSLSGYGTIGGWTNSATQTGNIGTGPNGSNLNGSTIQNYQSAQVTGILNRGSSSYASTGLSGYSGASLSGPGTVTGHVNGSALTVGVGASGAAGLSGGR